MSIIPIGLSAGHGAPTDMGASHKGIVESEYNMMLADAFAGYLTMVGGAFQPHLLRHWGEDPSHEARAERAGAIGCAFVLHFHVNAAKNPRFHGCLTFHMPDDKIGKDVGDTIMRCFPEPLHKPGWKSFEATNDPGDKNKWLQNPRAVMGPFSCPNVLVEVGYCTHEGDADALKDGAVKGAMLPALMSGLCRFRQIARG